MKTWTIPEAVAQKFAANDYVSACYTVWCVTPDENAHYEIFAWDSNGDGSYQEGTDEILCKPVAPATHFWGCGGTHIVRIVGDLPTNNGIAVNKLHEGSNAPCYFWYGEVIDPNHEPESTLITDLHVTDLSRSDAFTYHSNKS